jgi:ankyrin repeat protein
MKKYGLFILMLLSSGLLADNKQPLFDAINANDLTAVKTALETGVDVNKHYPDYMNATPLMVATTKNNLHLTEALISAGAEIDAVDENGDPAINWAAYYGFSQQVSLLLKHGASISLVGHGNALDVAMRRGHQELVLLLVTHAGTGQEMSAANMRLQTAIDEKSITSATTALESSADANGSDDTGRPLITRATRLGSVEMVLLLIAHGANVDALDPIGFTPLMEAARLGDASISEVLLKQGANPNHTAFKKGLSFTPMHQVAVGGSLEVLDVLLNVDALIDPLDSMGTTPAIWALFEGKKDLCLKFLNSGANPELKNEDDMSIASVARQYDVKEIVSWLDANEKD